MLQHWDKILVIAIGVVAVILLARKFRKGSCNCGSCGKECPARKEEQKK